MIILPAAGMEKPSVGLPAVFVPAGSCHADTEYERSFKNNVFLDKTDDFLYLLLLSVSFRYAA